MELTGLGFRANLKGTILNLQIGFSHDVSYKIPDGIKIIVENTKLQTYKGWWVHGEGQHIFKDQQTLQEYDLEFPNENMQALRTLYLAVCEMEYFPMECAMTGYLKKDILEKQNKLIVVNFEILYIEGCGE